MNHLPHRSSESKCLKMEKKEKLNIWDNNDYLSKTPLLTLSGNTNGAGGLRVWLTQHTGLQRNKKHLSSLKLRGILGTIWGVQGIYKKLAVQAWDWKEARKVHKKKKRWTKRRQHSNCVIIDTGRSGGSCWSSWCMWTSSAEMKVVHAPVCNSCGDSMCMRCAKMQQYHLVYRGM